MAWRVARDHYHYYGRLAMETAIYEPLGIEASRAHWAALRCNVVTDGDRLLATSLPHGADALLVVALGNGKQGNDAVAWAVAERQRQDEEKTRATAQARLAESVMALAKAVKPLEVRVLIERMLPSIPPAAQEEVRKMLRG